MKVVWLIAVAYALFEGRYCLNSTQNATEETVPPIRTTSKLENTAIEINNSTISWLNEIEKEATEIVTNSFEPPTNVELIEPSSLTKFDSSINETQPVTDGSTNSTIKPTVITNCANSVNLTCVEQSWNDTFRTNYSTVVEAFGVAEETPEYRLPNWAAIAAGIFLVSAALGYLSCVTYRQYLLKKYGNSQILIGEEVYDTTDLRNFEI